PLRLAPAVAIEQIAGLRERRLQIRLLQRGTVRMRAGQRTQQTVRRLDVAEAAHQPQQALLIGGGQVDDFWSALQRPQTVITIGNAAPNRLEERLQHAEETLRVRG